MRNEPINDCRDNESPARHNYQPSHDDIDYQAWLDEVKLQPTPARPAPSALAIRRAQYFEASAAPNFRKSRLAYVAPTLGKTLKHLIDSVLLNGLNPHILKLAAKQLAPYVTPYTVIVRPPKPPRRREEPKAGGTIALGLFIALFYSSLTAWSLTQPKALPDDAGKATVQVRDTDKPTRTRSKIINNSKGGVTIQFDQCRENENHHVSCQFTDSDGDQHWVYLRGLALPADK